MVNYLRGCFRCSSLVGSVAFGTEANLLLLLRLLLLLLFLLLLRLEAAGEKVVQWLLHFQSR